MRETLGREKDRVDKVWLIADAAHAARRRPCRPSAPAVPATVLRVPPRALAALAAAGGRAARSKHHMYVVDPLGNWMMRVPPNPEPARLKRDLEKLLRASAGWDKPGR